MPTRYIVSVYEKTGEESFINESEAELFMDKQDRLYENITRLHTVEVEDERER